jgi:hypothetical protein
MWEIYEVQGGLCALTGEPLTFKNLNKGTDQTASLDRIDSSLGYVEGNVQWVHKDVNLMKNVLSQARFIELCSLVSTNFK